MKTVAFTIVILLSAIGFAKAKAKPKVAAAKAKVQKSLPAKSVKAKAAPTVTKSAAIETVKVPEQRLNLAATEPKTLKVRTTRKSHSDLSAAISDSFEGRKEIQKDVQSAAGIEKTMYEPNREKVRIELPTTAVSSAGDDAPEPKFVPPPKRGPASTDTKGLFKEIDESEKEE